MSLNPEVSVVMSAFNSEEFISDSINSILNQEFKDFEFIIVNETLRTHYQLSINIKKLVTE